MAGLHVQISETREYHIYRLIVPVHHSDNLHHLPEHQVFLLYAQCAQNPRNQSETIVLKTFETIEDGNKK
jgi:hypothetical protein